MPHDHRFHIAASILAAVVAKPPGNLQFHVTIISVYFSSHKNHKIPKTPKKDTSQNHGSSSQPFPAQPSPRLVDVLCASDGQHGQVVRVVPVVPAFQKDRDLGFHLMARWPLEVGNMEIGLDSMLDLFSNKLMENI
jgi:hypothetical protein